MVSLFALRHKPYHASESGIVTQESSDPEFTGRIDHRLSFIFGSLFMLVLLVGGTSLYLLSSHLLKSDAIAKQSEQVHVVEQIDRYLQHLTSEIQLAQLQGRTIPTSLINTSLKDLEALLTRYKDFGGAERNLQEMRQIIAESESAAANFVGQAREGAARSRAQANTHDLEVMEAIQQRIQLFTDRVSMEHEAIEDELVLQTRQRVRMTIGFNVALVLIGVFFLLGAKRYFHRAIALPLRQLVEKSSEIAKGEFPKTIPVTSTDEIGRLSHAFNRMAAQLKAHEEKSKGLAILEERERLASELHDNLAQDLAFLRIKLIDAERNRCGNASLGAKQLLKELFPIVDEAYQNLREAIFGLRALALRNHVGLVAALADFLRDFSEVRKIPVHLKVDHPEVIRFSSQVEIQLIRIIHEALTNIVKHAQATKGKITIENDNDTASITIEDDGKGFCEDQSPEPNLHFGLQTMKDRAESVGGGLSVCGSPGRGTRVTIQLPLAKPNSDANHSIVAR
jgi:nitrate/nitrite-specific signal transduction histidine kinase